MLGIYRILTTLLAPLAASRLDHLGRSASPRAQAAAPTRRGRAIDDRPPQAVDVWCHAASVGEVNTIAPLIDKALDCGHRVLVTTFTPTGFDQALSRFGARVQLAFAPLDTHRAVRRWLDQFKPPMLVVAETELWPELFHQCHQRHVPVVLVNARLSDRHFKRYQRFSRLYRHALKAIVTAACQSPAQQNNWQRLGLSETQAVVTGNLKAAGDVQSLEREPKPPTGSFCWVAGSVHPKEFQPMIDAHLALIQHHPQAQLILAPRHLTHLDAIRAALNASGLTWQAFDSALGAGIAANSNVQVQLIDTMGALIEAYRQADVAFVGGSWVPVGGHNLYEPAAMNCAVLTGPHTHQQAEAKSQLQASGALVEVTDGGDLIKALLALADQPPLLEQMRQAGHAVVRQRAQSLEATWAVVAPWVGNTPSRD